MDNIIARNRGWFAGSYGESIVPVPAKNKAISTHKGFVLIKMAFTHSKNEQQIVELLLILIDDRTQDVWYCIIIHDATPLHTKSNHHTTGIVLLQKDETAPNWRWSLKYLAFSRTTEKQAPAITDNHLEFSVL